MKIMEEGFLLTIMIFSERVGLFLCDDDKSTSHLLNRLGKIVQGKFLRDLYVFPSAVVKPHSQRNTTPEPPHLPNGNVPGIDHKQSIYVSGPNKMGLSTQSSVMSQSELDEQENFNP